MPQKTLFQKYQELLLKIQKKPIHSVFGLIIFVCLVVFINTHTLYTEYQRSARAALPRVSVPAGTFTLVTEPEAGMAPVLNVIKNATSSIDVVMYEFDDTEIADALVSAQTRGVAVRVLLNQGYFDKVEGRNNTMYAYLQAHNIPVRSTPKYFALTHQKTIIADKHTALIMTFNFVPKYYATGRDFGILDTDINDVTAIENVFNSDWTNQKVLADNADDLVWSPGSESDMLLMINSAQKELDIYNEEMADARITQSLENAAKHGVNVNIIMTYQTGFKEAMQELKDSGAHLHLFHGKKGLYIHAKMIVADQSYAFLGSENFSYGSLEQNRELGIFLSDRDIVKSVIQTFATDWQNARPF